MDLWFNNQKVSSIDIQPTTTIGQLKLTLENWLKPQGYTNYQIRVVFNNNTELPGIVFDSITYDQVNFHAQANLIKGGKIYVTATKQIKPVKILPTDPCVGQDVNILFSFEEGQGVVVGVYLDIEDALRFWVNNYVDDREMLLQQLHATRGRINYNNPDVREFLYEAMADDQFHLYNTEIQ